MDAKLEGKPYTVRQLLAHTSGLPDYGQFPDYDAAVAAGDRPWPRTKMLDIAFSRGMLFESDQGWSYSNIGYLFVLDLIETASVKTLGQNISEIIYKP